MRFSVRIFPSEHSARPPTKKPNGSDDRSSVSRPKFLTWIITLEPAAETELERPS